MIVKTKAFQFPFIATETLLDVTCVSYLPKITVSWLTGWRKR
ncbi:hypothetical protein BN135_1166 [Cronobacter muytjensii 530]